MLLVVILNAVLAVMIVSVIVALHTKAIVADQVQHRRLQFVLDRRRRPRTPQYWPARRPAVRTARGPLTSAG